jgi:hypothetical protein
MVWSIHITSQKYMSENGIDDTVAQGNVGEETMHIEEENKLQGGPQEEGEIQADDELKQRVDARQEEKGKGGISEEEVSNSGLLASPRNQQTSSLSKAQHGEVISQQRTKRNAKKSTKQKEPNLYDLSKQLENHTKQLSQMGSIVEQLPRYLKNANTQSKIIKQINSSMNRLQRQIGQIQRSVHKKGKQK